MISGDNNLELLNFFANLIFDQDKLKNTKLIYPECGKGEKSNKKIATQKCDITRSSALNVL